MAILVSHLPPERKPQRATITVFDLEDGRIGFSLEATLSGFNMRSALDVQTWSGKLPSSPALHLAGQLAVYATVFGDTHRKPEEEKEVA
jgi:hypothetical protein